MERTGQGRTSVETATPFLITDVAVGDPKLESSRVLRAVKFETCPG